jgi:hypothetical protein
MDQRLAAGRLCDLTFVNVRFAAHYGRNSDIELRPKVPLD